MNRTLLTKRYSESCSCWRRNFKHKTTFFKFLGLNS